MSEHIQKTIADFEAKLRLAEAEVSRLKRTINDLCEMAGIPARFATTEPEVTAATLGSLRSDQFYGRPMATVVREYLELRKASNMDPPATVNEIYNALLSGGFKFEASSEKNAKDGLRISLAKNTAVFHKLPNSAWGLLEWYPNAKKKPSRQSSGNKTEDEVEDDGDPTERDSE